MLKNNNIYMFLMAVIFMLSSCKNDDITSDVPSQLFRPAMFEYTVNANEVTFSWIPIIGANYLIEISKDSLEFITDLQSFTLESETEFLVEDLWSNSRYSARIKSVSNDPNIRDSEYNQVTFVTNTENIFYSILEENIGTNQVLLQWNKDKDVSRIEVSMNGAEAISIFLTEEDKLAGEKRIEGLNATTEYVFTIYLEDMRRGTISVTTK